MESESKPNQPGRMSLSDSEDHNKREFVTRLVESAGWSQAEAEAEWDSIQNESEGAY